MKKLYKKEADGKLFYAEYWIDDNNKPVIHFGRVGKEGKSEKIDTIQTIKEEDFEKYFKKRFEPLGYAEITDKETYLLVVQFPMKSISGSKRDHWLKDKVMDYLNDELGWRGLGHIDGFDMGRQMAFPDKYALNIFCVVVDEDKGIAAIKRCLREYRLDYTKIKIASRPYLSDSGFELKYSAKKKDQTFSL